jgi:hypothetical protein
VGLTPGERRVGERLVIGSRPTVRLRHSRRGLIGRKTDAVDASLVQVSVTGALLVTEQPMRDVVVGSTVEIEIQGRRSSTVVRRVSEHHDMTLYGLEYRRVDEWFQALIDRAIAETRGDVRAASSETD